MDLINELAVLAESSQTDAQLHNNFKARFGHIDRIYEDFEKQHSALISLIAVTDNPDYELDREVRTAFMEKYFAIKSIYSTLFQNEMEDVKPASKSSSVRLPKIELPTFDGNYKDWPTYFNFFQSLIHRNSSLSDMEKFQYLLSSLSGEALIPVKNIKFIEENYNNAFTALAERYNNKRLLSKTCWQAIYDTPKLTNNSPQGLRKLLNAFSDNLASLKILGLPVENWDFVLFHILVQKLDSETLTRFELETCSNEIPSFSELKTYLAQRCTGLESAHMSIHSDIKSLNKSKAKTFPITQRQSSSLITNMESKSTRCIYCNNSHYIYKCPSFLSKTPSERFQITKTNNWCTNCLHSAHMVNSCSSRSVCRVCKGKHHTLLHIVRGSSNFSTSAGEVHPHLSVPSTSQVQSSPPVNSLANILPTTAAILLSTAVVNILDSNGKYQTIRVLLDTASQTNIITQQCVSRLGLPCSPLSLTIFGLGTHPSSTSKGVTCTICPRGQLAPVITLDAVVFPKICSEMPSSYLSIDNWNDITNLTLADPHFNVPGPIDLLLGADVFPLILRGGRLPSTNGKPTAIETIFGWILMGKVQNIPPTRQVTSLITSFDNSLDSTLKLFWELEEVPQISVPSPENLMCENLFMDNHFREESGRYSVALPFKTSEPLFGDSRATALRRFYALERRLLRNNDLYQSYLDFMQDYFDSGHMELVSLPPIHPQQVYYIPHHCVQNSSSPTTKLRVVFDASCKTVEGESLNDHLLIGPKLQKDIVTLLLHFRLHLLVFTADIKQMYRQINIHEQHRDFQRILWRFSPDLPVQEFRLKTVTYGVSSAPFLALRTLQQLAEDEKKDFPLAAGILRNDVYVDDIVTGCSTLDDAIVIKSQLISLLQRGGFNLRKWASNSFPFLATIPPTEKQVQSLSFHSEHDSSVKILGLKWLPSCDTFSYVVLPLNRSGTKRTILSELARIFDPLGFLAPLTFLAKHMIQHLWTLGLQWDETPPPDVVRSWEKYKCELPCLSKIQIPRCLVQKTFISCQLHAFCDSSEKGYAGVIYLRVEQPKNKFITSLVCAKSKVSPLKKISLPRLELCGAVLLSNLIDLVTTTVAEKVKIDKIVAWCDSSVVLSWIKSSPHRWKTFVGNRVAHIQERVPPQLWHHIRSSDNPADCASRGLFPSQLIDHPLWWTGPSWLQLPSHLWPKGEFSSFASDLPEERNHTLANFISLDSLDTLLDKYSSLSKIKRIIAYCLRFVSKLKNNSVQNSGAFTEQELHNALLVLIKRVQHLSFNDLVENLERGKSIPKMFRKLSIFIDEGGLLRVGGRLTHSNLLYAQKHPILLPRKHRLTELLIEDVHRQHQHAGLQTVQFLLLQNFWVLSSRRAVRHCLSKCIRCFRVKPTSFQPPMGDLPSVRINQIKPFQCVGVDYGGPFLITLGKSRGIKAQKAYICLFVCFATKAIHLELASDLTSECFLAALRRFLARRGRCTQLFSDCGTNFVGAKKELENLMKLVSEHEAISWSFNPPSAPHFGGLWESGIKSVKTHLVRVIGEQILTYEEMYTVLVQIEAVLNSRPLSPLSSDPHDLSVLTPGHFLTLEPLSTIPDPDLSLISMNRLSRWQLIQRIQQDFWKRWHTEYLHTLQQKNKWLTSTSPNIAPGMLVLIKNELCHPLKWKLGRVDSLHPGKDGIPRVATIRTSHGLMQRPLVKLCPLPVYNTQD